DRERAADADRRRLGPSGAILPVPVTQGFSWHDRGTSPIVPIDLPANLCHETQSIDLPAGGALRTIVPGGVRRSRAGPDGAVLAPPRLPSGARTAPSGPARDLRTRSEEHTSELQSRGHLV